MSNHVETDRPVECDNCDWKGTEKQMRAEFCDVEDLHELIEPGKEVPAGECPECGALAYLMKESPETCLNRLADAAREAQAVLGDLSRDSRLSEREDEIYIELREALAAAEQADDLKVVVEVRGGCAEVTRCPTGVKVNVIDHDNLKATGRDQ